MDQDFHRSRLRTAIVDRLTFAGNIIETGTVSYRPAQARGQRAPPANVGGYAQAAFARPDLGRERRRPDRGVLAVSAGVRGDSGRAASAIRAPIAGATYLRPAGAKKG